MLTRGCSDILNRLITINKSGNLNLKYMFLNSIIYLVVIPMVGQHQVWMLKNVNKDINYIQIICNNIYYLWFHKFLNKKQNLS